MFLHSRNQFTLRALFGTTRMNGEFSIRTALVTKDHLHTVSFIHKNSSPFNLAKKMWISVVQAHDRPEIALAARF